MAMGLAVNINGAADLVCQGCGAVQMTSFTALLLQVQHGGAATTSCPHCNIPHAAWPYAIGVQMEATPQAVAVGQPEPLQAPASQPGQEPPPNISKPGPGPLYFEITLPGQVSPFTKIQFGSMPIAGWPHFNSFDLLSQEVSRMLVSPAFHANSSLFWSGTEPFAIADLATHVATISNSMPSIAVRPAATAMLLGGVATTPSLISR